MFGFCLSGCHAGFGLGDGFGGPVFSGFDQLFGHFDRDGLGLRLGHDGGAADILKAGQGQNVADTDNVRVSTDHIAVRVIDDAEILGRVDLDRQFPQAVAPLNFIG